MEFFFFLAIIFVIIGLSGGKKDKTKTLFPKMGNAGDDGDIRGADDYPSSWRNYETAQNNAVQKWGMQDDFDGRKMFEVSKAKLERAQRVARNVAASKIAYEGLPKPPQKRRKSKSRKIGNALISKGQPPLVRDMNLSRRMFLSGGRGDVFGERRKSSGALKTLLSLLVLGLIVFGLATTLNSLP